METNYQAYSADDMKNLAEQGQRLNKGDLFLSFLKDVGYKSVDKDSFFGQDYNETIIISHTEEGIKFTNKDFAEDNGDFIQFLQNRMLEEGKVIPNKELYVFLNAVTFALRYEEGALVRKENISGKRPKSKRKGRGI